MRGPHKGSCSRNRTGEWVGRGGFKHFFVGEYACVLNYLYAALFSPKCFISAQSCRVGDPRGVAGTLGEGTQWGG